MEKKSKRSPRSPSSSLSLSPKPGVVPLKSSQGRPHTTVYFKCQECKKFSTEAGYVYCMMCGNGSEVSMTSPQQGAELSKKILKYVRRGGTSFEGNLYIRKREKLGSKWKKRFFIVRSSFLYFYDTPETKKPSEVHPLSLCALHSVPPLRPLSRGLVGGQCPSTYVYMTLALQTCLCL